MRLFLALNLRLVRQLVSVVLFFTAASGQSIELCENIFSKSYSSSAKLSTNLNPFDVEHNRSMIKAFALREGLPSFEVEIHGKFTPVILINKKTLQPWQWLFVQTMGLSQSLHPEGEANHGHARLPGKVGILSDFSLPLSLYFEQEPTAALMDLLNPENAGPNAAAGTGYRFKSVPSYFEHRHRHSLEYVDLVYSLTETERRQFWLYHAAKRIALVRVQHVANANNHWIVNQRRTLFHDDFKGDPMNRGYEQCNNSRCGQGLDIQISEIQGRLKWLLNKDLDQVLGSAEAQRFLSDAKQDLLGRDWRHGDHYDSDFLNRDHYLGLMWMHLRQDVSHEDKVDALSFLLALNIFKDELELKARLGIEEARSNQYGNPHITAIMIMSENPDLIWNFYQGDVHMRTAPIEKGNNGFDSSYFKTQNIFNEPLNESITSRYYP